MKKNVAFAIQSYGIFLCSVFIEHAGMIVYGGIFPLFSPIVTYYYFLFRPKSLPFYFVILIGFLVDFIRDDFIGFHPFLYTLFYVSISFQRLRFASFSFTTLWGIYAVQLGVYSVILFLFLYLTLGTFEIEISLRWGLGTLIYPPLIRILAKTDLRPPQPHLGGWRKT